MKYLTENVEPFQSVTKDKEQQHQYDSVDSFLLVIGFCSFLQTFHADLAPSISSQVWTPVSGYVNLSGTLVISLNC